MIHSDVRSRLQKRISSRMAALTWHERRQEVYTPIQTELADVAAYLKLLEELIRAVWDFHSIVAQVFPAALRQRSRRVRSYEVVARGRPEGPIHWPLSIKNAMRSLSLPGGMPEMVCRRTERQLDTPENLLLVETLLDLERRVHHLERAGLVSLSATEMDLVARMRRVVDKTMTAAARDHGLRTLTALGRPALPSAHELERKVMERLTGRRPAAPPWAGGLLRFRRRKEMQIPSDAPRSSGRLYAVFAVLEVLLALAEGTRMENRSGLLANARFSSPSDVDAHSPWAPWYILHWPSHPSVLIVPILVRRDAPGLFHRRLSKLLWNHPEPRTLSRWLVFHSGRVGSLPAASIPRGVDCFEIAAPIEEAPSAMPATLYGWLAGAPRPALQREGDLATRLEFVGKAARSVRRVIES